MKLRKAKIKLITFSGMLAAAYAAITVAVSPISYGVVQFRLSEVLCILPYFLPSGVWGLTLGCLVANLYGGNALDIVFGTLATLLSALAVAAIGKKGDSRTRKFFACLVNVLINAIIVGAVVTSGYNGIDLIAHPELYAVNALQVAIGEAAVMFILGFPLMLYLPGKKFFKNYVKKLSGRDY